MQSEMKRLLIAGGGGFGVEAQNWLRMRGVVVTEFLDDFKTGMEDGSRCTPIDAYEYRDGDQVLVSVGDPIGRESVVKRLTERGAKFHGLLYHIGPHTHRIGGGCVTCPYSVISAHGSVGDFVHINLHSTVGHHVTVGDYCTLSSHVDLCGNVKVGRGVFFGSGARVLPGVTIGDYAVIGAGAVVVRDVKERQTIYTQPGRVL